MKLSETIYRWKTELGELVEAYLEPDEITMAIRENRGSVDDIVQYRFFDERYQWSEWRKAITTLTPAGVRLILNGVKKNSEIEVQVRTSSNSWKSDVINQNLRILVQ